MGRRGRKGVRFFSVSGRVKEPGEKLAPAGVSARELIEEFSGGMAPGHRFAAYLPGGASGGILPASLGDLPLDFGTLDAEGCFVGSGAVVVLSDRDDLGGGGAQPRAFLPRRELRPMHPLPRRHRQGRADAGRAGVGPRAAARSWRRRWPTAPSAASARRR